MVLINAYHTIKKYLWKEMTSEKCDPLLFNKTKDRSDTDVSNRSFHFWWRRRELNSCPKPHPQELLRVHFLI